jgi:hypothetical protein
MSLKFVRLAHEAGLRAGDPKEIKVVGDGNSGRSWKFTQRQETFVSPGQQMIY